MKALEPGACFVCRRRDAGLGIGHDPRIGWLCQVCADDGHGKLGYALPSWRFDYFEEQALVSAGEVAGAYLDGLGRTDLASLHSEEWRHACRLIVDEFGRAMRRLVGRIEPAAPTTDASEEAENG